MSITSEDTTTVPPDDLPTNAAEFWGTPPSDMAATLHTAVGAELPVIDQLGSAPFKKEKGGFPFLGFLASVYEHVTTTANAELHGSTHQADRSIESDDNAADAAEATSEVSEATPSEIPADGTDSFTV